MVIIIINEDAGNVVAERSRQAVDKLSVGVVVGYQIEPARASQSAQGSQFEAARASQGAQGSQIEKARASQGV